MADNTLRNDETARTIDAQNDTEPATGHDVGIGSTLGAVGGAIVGALAGGPIGAVIGAIAGGAASGAAVDVVDKHDHDYARTTHATDTVAATDTYADTTPGRVTDYTGPGDYQRTHAAGTGVDSLDSVAPVAPVTYGTDTRATAPVSTLATDTDRKVELYEEELTAQKERVQTGEVTLHKEVITEIKSIDVPVTREEVVIERHAVSGAQAVAGNVNLDNAADEVIRIPVMEEQVSVQKTAVQTGEVTLGKREVTETQHVSDTVRREEVRIDNPDNVDVVNRNDTPAR